MRADKKKALSKVAKIALKDPTLTVREIAKKAGLGKSSAWRAMNDLGQNGTKNEDIIRITDTDKRIIDKAQRIIEMSIDKHVEVSEASGWMDMAEAMKASSLAKDSLARYALFRGNATDDDGGLKAIESIEIL